MRVSFAGRHLSRLLAVVLVLAVGFTGGVAYQSLANQISEGQLAPKLQQKIRCATMRERGADLSGCDLRGASLPGSNPYPANLTNATLVRANLSRVILRRANLEFVDLSWADLD